MVNFTRNEFYRSALHVTLKTTTGCQDMLFHLTLKSFPLRDFHRKFPSWVPYDHPIKLSAKLGKTYYTFYTGINYVSNHENFKCHWNMMANIAMDLGTIHLKPWKHWLYKSFCCKLHFPPIHGVIELIQLLPTISCSTKYNLSLKLSQEVSWH